MIYSDFVACYNHERSELIVASPKQLERVLYGAKFCLFLRLNSAIIIPMRLPNRKNAIIRREKLTNYLLSLVHPVGKYKAVFFRGIGFDDINVNMLEQGLYEIAQKNDVKSKRSSDDMSGINYKVIGLLSAQDSKAYLLETVWYIKAGTKNPSFVTANPV